MANTFTAILIPGSIFHISVVVVPTTLKKPNGTVSAGLESLNFTLLYPTLPPKIYLGSSHRSLLPPLVCYQRREGSYLCFSYLLWLVYGFKAEYLEEKPSHTGSFAHEIGLSFNPHFTSGLSSTGMLPCSGF